MERGRFFVPFFWLFYRSNIFSLEVEMKPADIIALDKKHVWHHLTQHKVYEDKDPAFIVEGKGARVKDLSLGVRNRGVACRQRDRKSVV